MTSPAREMADRLVVQHLTLDVLTLADIEELHALFSDPETHTIGDGPVTSIDRTREWLTGRELRRRQFGVTWYGIRSTDEGLVGNVGLFMGRTDPHPELGFEVRASEQSRGIGGLAARAVVEEAHRVGFEEVWATVRPGNSASLRALSRIGFVRERVEQDDRGELIFLWHRSEVPPGSASTVEADRDVD